MKKRIGVGVLFFLLSVALGFVVHWMVLEKKIHSPHLQLFWLSIPVVVLAVGDMLVFVSGEWK